PAVDDGECGDYSAFSRRQRPDSACRGDRTSNSRLRARRSTDEPGRPDGGLLKPASGAPEEWLSGRSSARGMAQRPVKRRNAVTAPNEDAAMRSIAARSGSLATVMVKPFACSS